MEVLMFVLYVLIVAVIGAPTIMIIGGSLIDYWYKKSAEAQAENWKRLAEAARAALEKDGSTAKDG